MPKDNFIEFSSVYDNLYTSWYMADWPSWKKRRVKKILSGLQINRSGNILDYGCGSGVFTRILKEVLPDAQVYGTDISSVGMKAAALTNPELQYMPIEELPDGYFDFIFTHHVLEHVEQVESVIAEFSRILKPEGKMLHILPCGNKGSLDYYIASNTINGILREKGDTFFYEEPLHLNRFTTERLESIFNQKYFNLSKEFYANHTPGCFYEMSGMNTQHIKYVTNHKNAKSSNAKFIFRIIRLFALLFYYLQRPYTYVKLKNKNKAWTGPLLRHPELSKTRIGWAELLLFPSWFFVLLREFIERLDWVLLKTSRSGSEMYLFFIDTRIK